MYIVQPNVVMALNGKKHQVKCLTTPKIKNYDSALIIEHHKSISTMTKSFYDNKKA